MSLVELSASYHDPSGLIWRFDEDRAAGHPIDEYDMTDWLLEDEVLTPAQEQHSSRLLRWRVMIRALDVPGVQKAVAFALADHCTNDKILCWPDLDTLAGETGFSRHTVMRAVGALHRLGVIYAPRRMVHPTTKRRLVNRYFLCWPAHRIALWRDRPSQVAESNMPCSREEHGPSRSLHQSQVAESDCKWLEKRQGLRDHANGASLRSAQRDEEQEDLAKYACVFPEIAFFLEKDAA